MLDHEVSTGLPAPNPQPAPGGADPKPAFSVLSDRCYSGRNEVPRTGLIAGEANELLSLRNKLIQTSAPRPSPARSLLVLENRPDRVAAKAQGGVENEPEIGDFFRY